MNARAAATPEGRLLALCGIWLLGLGLYFIFIRPPMLPEDLRFVGGAEALGSAHEALHTWLKHVFIVMGGFMLGCGTLTLALIGALNSRRVRVALWLVGLSTVGLMSAINFAIDSDFKWLLLVPALAWPAALTIVELRADDGTARHGTLPVSPPGAMPNNRSH